MLLRSRRALVLLGACVLVSLSGADGAEPLRLRVSPTVTLAPGFLTVRVSVEADTENRLLEIVAESADFYRSSEIQINGADGAPVNVVEFRNLPTGFYQVTAILIGTRGPRATVQRLARVAPGIGRDR